MEASDSFTKTQRWICLFSTVKKITMQIVFWVMESIDQLHVSHSKMVTVVDYDMSANEFLAGLPPQVCPPALLFRLGSRKVRRYKNTWIRNSSDAMAQQQWKVVRRRRSSEGCSTFPQKCHFTPMLSRHVCLTHGKSGHPGPGYPHQEGGHHQ